MSPGPASAAFGDGSRLSAAGEIGAGTKRPALGCEHDGAASGVGVEPLEGFADFGDQLAVEEIVRRTAHLDGGDETILADLRVAHLRLSSGLRLTISASTTVRPWPCGWTITGLRSISSISSAWSAAKRDNVAISSASAARSAGGDPRVAPSS